MHNVKTGAVTRQDGDGTGQTGTGEANAAGKAILTETSRTAADEAQASGSATAAALRRDHRQRPAGRDQLRAEQCRPQPDGRRALLRRHPVGGGQYDVELSATVDRFTLNGSEARLTVASGGTLSTVAEFNHLAGMVANSGTMRRRLSDARGGLQGTGGSTAASSPACRA
jgi:hypothetical protein